MLLTIFRVALPSPPVLCCARAVVLPNSAKQLRGLANHGSLSRLQGLQGRVVVPEGVYSRKLRGWWKLIQRHLMTLFAVTVQAKYNTKWPLGVLPIQGILRVTQITTKWPLSLRLSSLGPWTFSFAFASARAKSPAVKHCAWWFVRSFSCSFYCTQEESGAGRVGVFEISPTMNLRWKDTSRSHDWAFFASFFSFRKTRQHTNKSRFLASFLRRNPKSSHRGALDLMKNSARSQDLWMFH